VNIKLTTRSAVARLDGTDEYLDNEGARFKIPKELTPSKGVQELVLISAANPINQRAAVDFYRSLPSDFKSELKGIAASSSSNFEVSVNNIKKDIGVLRINWGSATDNALKVKIYRALIALPENSKITTMDLSDPNSPTVK
jgi:cell division septal protein FtsQ